MSCSGVEGCFTLKLLACKVWKLDPLGVFSESEYYVYDRSLALDHVAVSSLNVGNSIFYGLCVQLALEVQSPNLYKIRFNRYN